MAEDMAEDVQNIHLPMDESTARSLRLGEVITVSGRVFTGRSRFHIRAVEERIHPPLDYTCVNAFFHAGPVMRRAGTEHTWEVVSVEPTSSIRFERYGADVVRRFQLRTLIGKTTMGPRTATALAEIGGVYLSKIGVCGNSLRRQITKVREVHFLEELGKTEATWVFEVDRLGPFFVAMDARGRNYFESLSDDVKHAMPEVYDTLGIQPDFDYTVLDGADQQGAR